MKQYKTIALWLVGLTLAPGLSIHAQNPNQVQVQFAPGSSGIVLEGRIKGEEFMDYMLYAEQGQRSAIQLVVKHGAPYLMIFAPKATPGEDAALFSGQTNGNSYTGTLPTTGRYRIRVALPNGDAVNSKAGSYSLDIGLGAMTAPASGKPNKTEASPKGRSKGGKSAFELGYDKGLKDGAEGLSRTPEKYSSKYPEADRREFFKGYEDGYKKGKR